MACEYCNGKGRMFNFPEKWLIEKSQTIGDYDEPTIDVLVIGNELVATSERDHRGYSVEERTLIHFCPMCGEKLGDTNVEAYPDRRSYDIEMSDCSANAMKPKEPPKTCGGCCKTCAHLDMPRLRVCTKHHYEIDPEGRCFCGGEDYVECTDTIDQRYQKLEQVAKDLYNYAWCAWFMKINEQIPEVDKKLKEQEADSYLRNERKQLEALGVSVDE